MSMKASPAPGFSAHRTSILSLLALSMALAVYALSLRSEQAALRGELARARVDRDAARNNEVRLTAERDATRSGSPVSSAPAEEGTAPAAPKDDQIPGGLAQTFAAPEMRQMVRMEALTKAKNG